MAYEIDTRGLKYLDFLTYISLRSFNNKYKRCFPSHTAIGEKAGMSKNSVIQSIKRLEKAGLIEVKRSTSKRKSNNYYFLAIDGATKIPLAFFEINDLSIYQKAMLLCLRTIFQPDYSLDFNNIANSLGLSYQQVYKQYKSLVKLGYITETMKNDKIRSILNTEKVNWLFTDSESTKLYPLLKVS